MLQIGVVESNVATAHAINVRPSAAPPPASALDSIWPAYGIVTVIEAPVAISMPRVARKKKSALRCVWEAHCDSPGAEQPSRCEIKREMPIVQALERNQQQRLEHVVLLFDRQAPRV